MAQTLAQKIIARACGRETVTPGEIVVAEVDLAMIHDSGGPRRVKPILDRLGRRVWDRDRVVVITDHYVPAKNDEARAIQDVTRRWVADEGVRSFYDGMGICHVVLPEKGHLTPGMFVVGGDSHSPTGGAFGAYMFGVGATEMAGVLATGEIWLKVPETISIEWTGRLSSLVSAKDMMLHACGMLGMDGGRYQAIEYSGSAVTALDMQERMTLANMAAELGGQAGLVAPDDVTVEWLKARGRPVDDVSQWSTDADAPVLMRHRFDAESLSPQVAAPHSPANAAPVDAHAGQSIDVAYIGACTGAKLDDLRMAASVMQGRRLATGVTLMVAPASAHDQAVAASEGIMARFEELGATILPNACGICAGYGESRLGEDVRCISTTARNFRGRMGAASSEVYLASPYTVAASAIAGRIADPREVVGGDA